MVYKAFREIISGFIKALTQLIGGYTFGAEETLYRAIDAECTRMISSVVATAPDIINRELKGVITALPLKYNKTVIDSIYSDISIFKNISSYSKYETDKMKKIILQGKYSNKSTDQISVDLQNILKKDMITSLDITKRRALLVARAESQNLDGAVKDIYFSEFRDKYDKVWVSLDGARQQHAEMNGKVAGSDGMFSSPWGKIPGPQAIPQKDRWNCRCATKLVIKKVSRDT